MIILNHPLIPAPTLTPIASKADIVTTKANEVVWFDYDLELLRYCYDQQILAAVHIDKASEAVYANALGAKFVTMELDLAKEVQKIAEHYLFDTKVIAMLDERLLEKAIEMGIDGVYLTNRAMEGLSFTSTS